MGRTLPPFRPALEMEIATWNDFRRALRPNDRPILDDVVRYAKIHADAGSMACRPLISDVIFMCALMEQQKMIQELTTAIEKMNKEIAILKSHEVNPIQLTNNFN